MTLKKEKLKRIGMRALPHLLIVSTVYLGICFALARALVSPARTHPTRPEGLDETAISGIPSWCTRGLLNGQASRVVFVFAHGYGGDRQAFGRAMLDLHRLGFDSVEPALPGQDSNPLKTVGFGKSESEVLVGAADWVRKRSPGSKVVYVGVSMGGAAVWLAADRDPFAAAVVSEGSYARLDKQVDAWFDSGAPGSSVYLRPTIWIASDLCGINPAEIVPLDSAVRWKGRPALVIQGACDKLIAMEDARQLASASGAPLWIVPDAVHADCYGRAPKEYIRRLVGIADQCAKGRSVADGPGHSKLGRHGTVAHWDRRLRKY